MDGRAWINSSTLVGRANLIYELIQQDTTRFDQVKLQEFASKLTVSDAMHLSDWFTTLFFVEELSMAEKEQMERTLKLSPPDRWASNTMNYLASRPKIHLS